MSVKETALFEKRLCYSGGRLILISAYNSYVTGIMSYAAGS